MCSSAWGRDQLRTCDFTMNHKSWTDRFTWKILVLVYNGPAYLRKVATGAVQGKQMFVIQVRKMEIWEWCHVCMATYSGH